MIQPEASNRVASERKLRKKKRIQEYINLSVKDTEDLTA